MTQQALGSAMIEFHHLYWTRITELMAGAFETEFTKSQFMVLGLAASHRGVTMTALAGHTGMLKQQVTRIVDKLEARGFVRRERSGSDRRSVSVHATALAAGYLAAFEQRCVRRIMVLLQGLTCDERDRLQACFETVNALLRKLPAPADPPDASGE